MVLTAAILEAEVADLLQLENLQGLIYLLIVWHQYFLLQVHHDIQHQRTKACNGKIVNLEQEGKI